LGHESLLGHRTTERGLSGGAVESTESERGGLRCRLLMGEVTSNWTARASSP
jgi:hypothetical protein